MPVQPEWLTRSRLCRFDSEDLAALWMQGCVFHEIVNPFTGLKGRIQLNQRFGQKEPLPETLLDMLSNPLISNVNEAFDVACI